MPRSHHRIVSTWSDLQELQGQELVELEFPINELFAGVTGQELTEFRINKGVIYELQGQELAEIQINEKITEVSVAGVDGVPYKGVNCGSYRGRC